MATQQNVNVHKGESVTVTFTLSSAGEALGAGKAVQFHCARPSDCGSDFDVTTTTNASGEASIALTAVHTAYAGRFPFWVWNTTDDDLHVEGILVVEHAEVT